MKKKDLRKAKSLFLILLLVVCAVFVLVKRDTFYEVREYYALNFAETEFDLGEQSDTVITQQFKAKQSDLEYVYLRFHIEELVGVSGHIKVSVLDENEKKLYARVKPISRLTQTETVTWTEFAMPAELEKGKVYTLKIETGDIEVAEGSSFSLYIARNREFLFKDLTLDGKEDSHRLEATFKYNTYCSDYLILMLLLLALAGGWVLCLSSDKAKAPLKKFRKVLHLKGLKNANISAARVLLFLTPFAAFFITQRFCGYGFFSYLELLFSLRGLINIILYSFFCMLFYVLTNRTKYTSLLVLLISYLCGLINYYVWNFRGCPIVAADISSIKTAANVADNYSYSMGMDAVWSTVLLVFFLCLILQLKSYPGMRLKRRFCLLLASGLLCLSFWGVFFQTSLMQDLDISVSVWMPQRDYAKNGSALSFLLSWTYFIVDKPSGYSQEAVSQITSDYTSDEKSDSDDSTVCSEKQPNIIAIMNESFSDLAVDCNLETNEDYMPFIHNLEENTIKGSLYVSVLGGNTANTEFEFLTGNSLAFFPARSVPYNSYVNHQLGSLTWTLKGLNYANNTAVHPYYSNGWSREKVYPLLGFDRFLSQDDFMEKSYVREFISDNSDFQKLIELYEESSAQTDQPIYEFSVTMQNHGGYLGTHGLVEEPIQITNLSNVNDQITQYLNLIRQSDDAFKELVSYFEKVDEPTIIVMFGDHQPGFTDSAYNELFGCDTSTLGIEDTMKMYQTPYVIWANYDIEEAHLDMSANYLSSFLLNLTGQKLTGYNKYLLDLQKKLPVISAIGYIGDDGVVRSIDEESSYSEIIKEYQMIQYNQIFDNKHMLKDFFYLKE